MREIKELKVSIYEGKFQFYSKILLMPTWKEVLLSKLITSGKEGLCLVSSKGTFVMKRMTDKIRREREYTMRQNRDVFYIFHHSWKVEKKLIFRCVMMYV